MTSAPSMSASGTVGVAIDASEADALKLGRWCGGRRRTQPPHARPALLQRLPCSTAKTPARTSYNRLPTSRLCGTPRPAPSSTPTLMIFQRARPAPAGRKLPEQPDFRAWKAKLHEAYRAGRDRQGHLVPARRHAAARLRVTTTQNPEGGVTYLFDDVTESSNSPARFDGMIRVQRERRWTASPRASRCSAATARRNCSTRPSSGCGSCPADAMRDEPHIQTVEGWCHQLFDDGDRLATDPRGRHPRSRAAPDVPLKLERKDGSVLDGMIRPLHDGATMLTFQDITDTENVEARAAASARGAGGRRPDEGGFRPPRLLRAALAAHHHHRLRAFPQRSIDRAADAEAGRISRLRHQIEPTRWLALTNNILDLATIDAGAMKLELGTVDVSKTIELAAEGIQDRLATDPHPSQGRNRARCRQLHRRREARGAGAL